MGERGDGCKKCVKGNELEVPKEENLNRKTEADYWEAFWAVSAVKGKIAYPGDTDFGRKSE